MAGLSRVTANVNTQTGGGIRQAVGVLALIGAIEATGSSNTPAQYYRASDVATDFGDGSRMHEVAKDALRHAPSVIIVAAGGATDPNGSLTGTGDGSATFTDTITGTSQTGVIGDTDGSPDGVSDLIPFTAVTAVVVDSTPIAGNILYTHETGAALTALSVTAGDAVINPRTGEYKLGTAPATDAAFTFTAHDWDAALAELDANFPGYETHSYTEVYSAQSHGVIMDTIVAHGAADFKSTVSATASGYDPADADSQALATLGQDSSHIIVVDNYTSGEAVGAHAARLLQLPVSGSAEDVEASTALSRDGTTYLASEIGDLVTPGANTLLGLGLTPVYKDEGGTYRYVRDRGATGLTSFFRHWFTYRSVALAKARFEEGLRDLRRSSSDAVPFNGRGRTAIIGALKKEADRLAADNVIEVVPTSNITVPPPSSISSSNILARHWPGLAVDIVIPGQAGSWTLDLNARLGGA